jgi:hypothetical protein
LIADARAAGWLIGYTPGGCLRFVHRNGSVIYGPRYIGAADAAYTETLERLQHVARLAARYRP